MKIRKAVIPAAGYGTRFLPMTKASPKEMLPVIDKPIIQYAVEEAIASGIEDIIIITGANKRAIEDHFDHNSELERFLRENGKEEMAKEIHDIGEMANFIYVRQKGPYGNGTPVLNAEPIIGSEPFAVLWGDQFTTAEPPRLKQMIDVFEKYKDPVLSFVPVKNESDYDKYGIPKVEKIEDGVHEILEIVEKPGKDQAPSHLFSDGGYILTPDIFAALKETKLGKSNELWLVDGINKLKKNHKLYACEVKGGQYHDTGNKLEYLKTNVEFGLKREDIGAEFKEYLKTLKL